MIQPMTNPQAIPILQISGINVYYGESHIFAECGSLNCARRKWFCLIGRNGVGKTTLLKNHHGIASS